MSLQPNISFRLKNFRAFKDTGLQQLRPLTFLVGENSAGKSSLLSALNYLLSFRDGGQKSSFNSPPFELGGFDQIVHSRKGVQRPKSFELELQTTLDLNEPTLLFQFGRFTNEAERRPDIQRVTASILFSPYHGETRISRITVVAGEARLRVEFGDQLEVTVTDKGKTIYPREGVQPRLPMFFGGAPSQRVDPQVLRVILTQVYSESYNWDLGRRSERIPEALTRVLSAAVGFSSALPFQTIASAPTRSSPQRVYNPSDFVVQPDGSHTPYVLNRLKSSDKTRWEKIKRSIEAFGEDAGLFTKLHVSKYPGSDSSPFQIGVTVNGRQSNLIDVGYGVSQSLPIVVDALDASQNSYFLLQQPEVHLHPQAQAALGSFFASQVTDRDLGFVIETHSDFIINRARIEIMNGKLDPNLVTVIYFEKLKSSVELTHITIDENGNLNGDPPKYRKFFLQEGHRLLGVS